MTDLDKLVPIPSTLNVPQMQAMRADTAKAIAAEFGLTDAPEDLSRRELNGY